MPSSAVLTRAPSPAQRGQQIQSSLSIRDERVRLIPRVARENRGNHLADARRLVLREYDFLEAAVVPCFDVDAERADTLAKRRFEIASPIDGFASQLPVEYLRAEARRPHPDRDTR